jgi:16S rRNA (cytosine967-C5)-methyltransferase
MTPAAKLAAAIEVFAALETDRRPAADALKAWGLAHRFAGSGDRAGIAGLVYDALRRKASSAYLMGEDSPRAIVIGMLKRERGLDTEAIARLADGSAYGPAALSDDERKRLDAGDIAGAPPHIAGDYPEWLDPHFTKVFGAARAAEGEALASRAPLDLRVNILNAERDRVGGMLSDLKPKPTRWSPWGLRVALAADAKSPAIHAEPAFLKGLVEVQDEGSQLAALLSGAQPGEQVIDLCAGAGGKTLALAAMMGNKGQVFATDDDKRRLAPIHDRLARSGARNVQVRTPKSIHDEIDDLKGRMDMVLIDAPCTGTGSWRRNPDAKWRMRPGALEQRVKEQADILDRAVALVKPTGRIVYITCSVLDEENGAQVRGFIGRHPAFAAVPAAEVAKVLGGAAQAFGQAARLSADGILMTPRTTETDGFFVSVLKPTS